MLAAAPAELPLDRLDPMQHLLRVEIAFDDRDGIGEVAPGAADRRIENDRRGVEQAKLLVQAGNGGLDHLLRPSVAAVGAVRPDRDGVEVRHAPELSSPPPSRKRGSRCSSFTKRDSRLRGNDDSWFDAPT